MCCFCEAETFTCDICFIFTPVELIKHKPTHLEEGAAFVLYYNELV